MEEERLSHNNDGWMKFIMCNRKRTTEQRLQATGNGGRNVTEKITYNN